MRSEHFLYLQISFAVEWKFGIQHGWGEVKVVVYPLRTKDVIEMCVGKKEEYRLQGFLLHIVANSFAFCGSKCTAVDYDCLTRSVTDDVCVLFERIVDECFDVYHEMLT